MSSLIAGDELNSESRSFVDANVEPGKTYHYELLIRTDNGSEFRSPIATAIPVFVTSLGQNQPNPFNPITTIQYTLGERSSAVLDIHDASGALVARLDQGIQAEGTHQVQWDGRDAQGRAVASGVYFYRLEGLKTLGSRKMVLLK